MANIIRNFIDSLHLADDDETDEEYEEYLMETNEKERRRELRGEKRLSRRFDEDEEDAEEVSYRPNTSNFSDLKRERSQKADRERPQTQKKVVPFRCGSVGSLSSAMGIKVMKPTSFDDSQDICDVLLAGKATIINLEGFNVDEAQRVMDFVSGAVYAANGKLHQISNYIFIISPENVDITGDYLDMIRQNGFEVPTLSRI